METARELRKLLSNWADGDNQTLGSIVVVLMQDLIARREAEETKGVTAEAEALRARVFADCTYAMWQTGLRAGATTLTHKPTGLSAAAPTRDAALDSLIVQLRALGAL